MQTFFQNFMTEGDYETFYPYIMGVGKGAPNNFESSFNKECGTRPLRIDPKYNPQVKIETVYYPSMDCGLNPDLRPEYFHDFTCVCTKGDCDCRFGSTCCNNNKRKKELKARAWAEFSACRERNGKVMIQGNVDAFNNAEQRYKEDLANYEACKSAMASGNPETVTPVTFDEGTTTSTNTTNAPASPPTPNPFVYTATPLKPKPRPKPKPKPRPAPVTIVQPQIVQKESAKENKNVNLYVAIGIVAIVLLVGGYFLYKFSKK